jgi:hypothetical protein
MTIVTSTDVVAGTRDKFISRLLIATKLFAEKYFIQPATEPLKSETAKNAEAMFNDPASGVYGSAHFAAIIKAQTGEDIKMRNPNAVTYQVGVCVVPVDPQYGERSHDGYEVGKAYVCVNETSGGKFRNADNAAAKSTNGKSNQLGVMSPMSDEVRPATQEEIVKLADELLAVRGLTLLQDLEPELSRYDHFLA